MKILVTADWHLGKKLHNEDLGTDMALFFDWLLDKIQSEGIEYLMVAGDIFDTNNPGNEATKQYFKFIKKLSSLNCKGIFIAGNHDSPAFIDVPKELLMEFDISVVGLFPGMDQVDKIFFPLLDKTGKEVAVVAAIPFLQDRFVRQVGEGEGAKEIAEKIKQGMKLVFEQIGTALKERYPDLPTIGMAHLHAQGMDVSDAERDIQIGNQEGIASHDLDQFDYLALGHIHTGQTVIPGKIQYASSPISLSFAENRYNHKVVMLEILGKQITEQFIPVPKTRSLYQLEGNMQQIEGQVMQLKKKYELQGLLDIKIVEEKFDPTLSDRLEALKIYLQAENHFKIVQNRIVYLDKSATRISNTYDPNALADLRPEQVLNDLIANRETQEQAKLLEIFNTIYADVTQA